MNGDAPPCDSDTKPYSGVDNLELMRLCRNYNHAIAGLLAKALDQYKVLLDFGAGAGELATAMRTQGHEVLCLEVDHSLKDILGKAGHKVIDHLEAIEPESLDGYYAINVLEHIQDDREVAIRLREKLKPGGRAVIYVPAFESLYSAMDRKVGHCRRYRMKTIKNMLSSAGYRIEESRHIDSLGYLASLLYKWLGNDRGDLNTRALIIYDRFFFPLSRILDSIVHRWIGKNIVIVCRKN